MTTIKNLQTQLDKITEEYRIASKVKDWTEMKRLNDTATRIQEQIYYELYWKKGH